MFGMNEYRSRCKKEACTSVTLWTFTTFGVKSASIKGLKNSLSFFFKSVYSRKIRHCTRTSHLQTISIHAELACTAMLCDLDRKCCFSSRFLLLRLSLHHKNHSLLSFRRSLKFHNRNKRSVT